VEKPHAFAKQLLDPRVEIGSGASFFYSKLPSSAGGTEPRAVPDLALRVARPNEENRVVPSSAEPIGGEERLGLLESGQVIEVAIGAIRMEHIAVANLELRRGKKEEAVAEAIEQLLSPFAEDVLRNRHFR
jgi:hypothetical protein